MSGVLDGIRVLDFGRYIAGPYCATLLADMGADVIRVERPVIGSEDRWVSPIASGGEGALFMQMNRNKRCLTLNPKKPEGRAIVRQLVQRSDVVVANLPPQTLEEIGLDYPTLKQTKDDIILTTVSAFGHGGPYSHRVGFDGIAQAISGAMYLSGTPDEPTAASTTRGSTSPPRSSPRSGPWRRCSSARRPGAASRWKGRCSPPRSTPRTAP